MRSKNMNAARKIGIEEIKASGGLIHGKNYKLGMGNLPFSELDTRDWILTPELHDAVTQFESNFNITGNPDRNHIRLTHNLRLFSTRSSNQISTCYDQKDRDQHLSMFQCFLHESEQPCHGPKARHCCLPAVGSRT